VNVEVLKKWNKSTRFEIPCLHQALLLAIQKH